MKLTKEDIMKYGTKKEKSQLYRAKMGSLEYYFESMYNQMDWDMGKEEIITILREVYEKGHDEGYETGKNESYDAGKDW